MKLNLKLQFPIHYGSIVGTKQDATDLVKLVHQEIQSIILIK